MALTTLTLAAALWAGQEPKLQAQKGLIVEIRGYLCNPQAKPARVDVIETINVDDQRPYFPEPGEERP